MWRLCNNDNSFADKTSCQGRAAENISTGVVVPILGCASLYQRYIPFID